MNGMDAAQEDSIIILDTLPQGYIRFDSTLRVTFINSAAEAILERTRAEVLGQKLKDLFQSDLGTNLEENCRRAIAVRKPVTLEHWSERWHTWCAITAMPDPNGGVVVQFSDITGQKAMENALRTSEEKFSKAFHSSPVSMCIVDVEKNSSFIEVNEAFQRTTGYSRDELIGRTSTEIGLYDNPQDLVESRKRLLSDGGYRDLEIRFRRKNGDILVGLISAEQMELGGKLCALAAAVDITERRRAQEALLESEELYRQLFDLESDVIVLGDRISGRLLAVNAAATVLYGYDKNELLAMNRVDLSAEPEETVQSTVKGLAFIPLRWHRKKDGTVFPVEICGAYFDLKGRQVFVSAIRDITTRLRMEEALKKSEEKFFKAFHSNPAAITIADLTTRTYLEVNESFEEMMGFRSAETVGRTWTELSLWADPHDRDEAVAQLLREGRLRDREFRFRKKNGEMGSGILSADLIEIDGRPCTITATVDVTARLHLEGQLRQAQKLESVGRLAGGVAHDFNNLLTVINGYSDFVLGALNPADPLYSQVQQIKKAGERAARLTSQLLAFSRKQVVEPKSLNLNAVVNDAHQMLQRLIGEDIELNTRLDPLLGPVMADRGQIDQVIMNLVVNARDAMPTGGKLEITTRNVELDPAMAAANPEARPGKYALLSVHDTGTGIDDRTLPNIFEPFFTTKERGQGTGLGLSTAYGIIQQAGGWIDVQSELGRGATFQIYLPRADAASVRVAEQQQTPEAARGGETILVVEDSDETRTLTTTILSSYGYNILEAANGTEALSVEEKYTGEIHLLLTDVIMPGMNGKELSEQLRLRRPGIRILFTSGYPADVISRRGVLEKEIAYLPKPFTPNSLAAKVREILAGSHGCRHAGGAPRT
jgi:PAS domain S-box-containing protein